MNRKMLRFMGGLAVVGGVMSSARAQFSNGTLVMVRVGDGTGTVPFDSNNFAQPISLDVYNAFTGGLIGTHALPSGAADPNRIVMTARNDDHDGHLNLSSNGQYLTLGGYRAAPGATYASTVGATSATTPRVVARVDSSWNIDTTTGLTNAYDGLTITAVVSDTGQRFWTAGGGTSAGTGGLRYVPLVGSTQSINVSQNLSGSTADSMRSARMVNGQVYISTASQGSYVNRGTYIMKIGGGLPIAAVNTASTATPVIINKEGSLTDFSGNPDPDGKGKLHPKSDVLFLDIDLNGTLDTAYSTGGKEEMEKWTFNGSAWLRSDVMYLSSGAEINALDYMRVGGTVDLFISTDLGVYRLLDTGGIGTIVSGQVQAPDFENKRYFTDSYFITAGANTQFRGVAVVPEPIELAVMAIVLLGLSRRRNGGRI